MKCRGKPDTIHDSAKYLVFPRYISCYIAESIDYLWDSV